MCGQLYVGDVRIENVTDAIIVKSTHAAIRIK
jgi:hypothetical protein